MEKSYLSLNRETANIASYIETLKLINLKVDNLDGDINSNLKGIEVKYLNESLNSLKNEIIQVGRLLSVLNEEILEAADEL